MNGQPFPASFDFVVVHIPHASVSLPSEYRKDIVLNDKALWRELCRSTDMFCDELYDTPEFTHRLCADVSRLICDVERFRDDRAEHEAKKGRGLMYTRTSWGRRFRKNDPALREKLLREIYDPHHRQLSGMCAAALERSGKCLIIDGHSFSSHTRRSPGDFFSLPDFDIGADRFHTPPWLVDRLVTLIKNAGYTVKVNNPYAGAIVPLERYRQDARVFSVMIEVNRRLYLHEKTLQKNAHFEEIRRFCHELTRAAASAVCAVSP